MESDTVKQKKPAVALELYPRANVLRWGWGWNSRNFFFPVFLFFLILLPLLSSSPPPLLIHTFFK